MTCAVERADYHAEGVGSFRPDKLASVPLPSQPDAPRDDRGNRLRTPGRAVVTGFLILNLAARLHALSGSDTVILTLALLVVIGLIVCLVRPRWVGSALTLFGASFFLYGFHAYSSRSQIFDLAVSGFALALVVRMLPEPTAPLPRWTSVVFAFAALYSVAACASLLLLPARVLEHRVFLESGELARAALTAFPKDPFYSIAGVGRLWLYVAAAWALSAQPDAGVLLRGLIRGIAGAAIAAVVLGLLDFAGVLSLDGYNQSQLFFGAQYRRLQSTFGNPSWFACFVVCALPFVVLEWGEASRPLSRLSLAIAFPLAALALLLSGARAAWLGVAVLLAAFAGLQLVARRLGGGLPRTGALEWRALAASLLVSGLLLAGGEWRGKRGAATSSERLDGLIDEIQLRGLGVATSSPRRVAAEYALELAKQRPLLGLGYESFNLHLRAQLALPASPVARVVNTALAQDSTETVFDDSHNTYLQVLSGTGVLGLGLWLAFAASALAAAVLAFCRAPGTRPAALVVGMLLFHYYGLFQGMAYIPVIHFLLFVEVGYAAAIAPAPPARLTRWSRIALGALGALVLAALPFQVADRGYRDLKRTLGVLAYLPDEATEFEGFYRAETGPGGEFRWMARRGVVNVAKASPFRLTFTCEHPDLESEPVVVTLRFEGEDVGSVVCRRRGTQEKRFDPAVPGALRLSVSRTFRPPGSDRRELGVAVSAIRWEQGRP
jgi:O-antigen ligase